MEDNIHQKQCNVARRLKFLYEVFGRTDYIGEKISILEHSLQAANEAAKVQPTDNELILAALLHDIGHLLGIEANITMEMEGCGMEKHEHHGAKFLRKIGFSERVAGLVDAHVAAKRYLCYKQADYHATLTEASKTTLKYQGGVMNEEEAKEFESHVDFDAFLMMRRFDEAAKIEDLLVPSFDAYLPMIQSHVTSFADATSFATSFPYVFSDLQIRAYRENGYLLIKSLISFFDISVDDLNLWTQEISDWPKEEGKWLKHSELTGDGKTAICRSENFAHFHSSMGKLAIDCLVPFVSQLFGEEAVLFKEKINYKCAGGAGFAAHQDSPAYIGLARDHISVMVAIDDANQMNGCLQVAAGCWKAGDVLLDDKGILTREAEEALSFTFIECSAGDVMFFGGFLPHRSAANRSNSTRRAMFLTYNPLSQGNFHSDYYRAKHSGDRGFDQNKTISFQGDFQGAIVD